MEQLQILWVTKSYAVSDGGVKTHTHPYYHMFYVESGICTMVANGVVYDLMPGQCILIPPETEHSYSNEQSVALNYQEIKFTSSKDIPLRVSDSALVGSLLQKVVQEYSLLGHLADKSATTYTAALLYALTEEDRLTEASTFQYVDASTFNELSQRIIRYLEANYQRDLRLDDLAQAVGNNKSYLCVAFKKDTGFTILDCLNTIRIRRAAELIVYSDHSLAQVADMCGFASVSHFNRVFLKYAGITPGQCRRAYPADIWIEVSKASTNCSDLFMYSVLAHKTITPEMIQKLDATETKEK